MAGIDVARHGLGVARLAVAGVGPLSTVRGADSVRLADRRRGARRWPAAALVVSLLAHGVAVMLLFPNRSRPLAVPTESSFELVFEPAAETALSSTVSSTALLSGGQEGVEGGPPATMTGRGPSVLPAVVPKVPLMSAEPQAVAPASMPASEPRDVSPLPPAVAPPAPAPPRQAARPARQAAPPQRPAAAAPSAASPAVAAGAFVPPSPVAGMEINRAPAYPQSALRRGEQGNVMLRVNVSAGGAPLSVDLAATSGYASLDGAAEAAVGQWRFNPATRGGIPVAAIADVPIRFRLTN